MSGVLGNKGAVVPRAAFRPVEVYEGCGGRGKASHPGFGLWGMGLGNGIPR